MSSNQGATMSEAEVHRLELWMTEINGRLKNLEATKTNPADCLIHTGELDRLREKDKNQDKEIGVLAEQVGKQNMLKIGLGALGAGIVLAIKYGGSALWENLKN